MRLGIVVSLLLAGCGSTQGASLISRVTAADKHAPVPNVVGMSAPDAAVVLEKVRYCVKVKPGSWVAPGSDPQDPVQGETPAAGSSGALWSPVVLSVGIPKVGHQKHPTGVSMSLDSVGGPRQCAKTGTGSSTTDRAG